MKLLGAVVLLLVVVGSGCTGAEPISDESGIDARYVAAFRAVVTHDSSRSLVGVKQAPVPVAVIPGVRPLMPFTSADSLAASDCANPDRLSPGVLRDSLYRRSLSAPDLARSRYGRLERLSSTRLRSVGPGSEVVLVVAFSEPVGPLLLAEAYDSRSIYNQDLSFVMGTSFQYLFCFGPSGTIERTWIADVSNL